MVERSTPNELTQPTEVFLPPNVTLTILFSSHNKREDLGDFDGFKKILWGSDIFIPEVFNWIPKDLSYFRQISQGNPTALREHKEMFERNHDMPEFGIGLSEALFKSHVKVVLADVPRGTKEAERIQASQTLIGLTAGTFDEALDCLASHYTNFSSSVREREEFILKQIGDSLTRAIQESDKLKKKDKIDVLMTLGANHANILERLNGVASAQRKDNGSTLPLVQGLYGHVIKDFSQEIMDGLGKGEDVKMPLAKRLASVILEKTLINGVRLDPEMATNLADQLTLTEIESLYQNFKRS